MRSQDPARWFNDLSVHVDDQEVLAEAKALEATLFDGRSRFGGGLWIIFVSMVAGAFGGFTFSEEVRSSWPIFIVYLTGGALLLRALSPLSRRLVGPADVALLRRDHWRRAARWPGVRVRQSYLCVRPILRGRRHSPARKTSNEASPRHHGGQLSLVGIIAIFVAELGLLFWGILSRRPTVGLLAVFAKDALK